MNSRTAQFAGLGVVALVLGVAGYLLWRKFAKPKVQDGGTEPGGVPGLIGDAAGGNQFSDVRAGAPYANETAPPKTASKPVEFIVGRFLAPQDGGSVNRPLFGSLIRFRAEVSNTGNQDWTGPLTLAVDEDYLITDAKGMVSETLTIPARTSRPVDFDYRLSANFVLREPLLYGNLYAGQRHLAWVGPVAVI